MTRRFAANKVSGRYRRQPHALSGLRRSLVRRRSVRAVLFTAVAATTAALVCAPIAAADDQGNFMNELSTNGAKPPNMGYRQIVSAGYQTCSELRSGTSVLDEMTAVENRYHFNQGTLFVSAATTNLCPDFAG
jgi:hypothetical protein